MLFSLSIPTLHAGSDPSDSVASLRSSFTVRQRHYDNSSMGLQRRETPSAPDGVPASTCPFEHVPDPLPSARPVKCGAMARPLAALCRRVDSTTGALPRHTSRAARPARSRLGCGRLWPSPAGRPRRPQMSWLPPAPASASCVRDGQGRLYGSAARAAGVARSTRARLARRQALAAPRTMQFWAGR